MKTPVYIDSCAWNYLFETQVVMSETFPSDEFSLFITREVEIELQEIPDVGHGDSDKRPLKQFIQESIAQNSVCTTGFFGFRTFEKDGTPSKTQVNLGFNQGGFQPTADRDWYAKSGVRAHLDGKPIRKSGLGHNQADASLGVRSFGAIVLTNEKKTKSGPLRLAAEQSGQVLYLEDLAASNLSLKDFMLLARQRWTGPGA
ncbi:hypothetical protein [Variovorax sp. EL159]|uniref:hypothetical protein n=1 Tax=Variovorax sp. EL159 TaxID=1566270 RepID=UPI00088445DD|nr:hypothetical protein [Variovorax sp. EL159]SCX74503.1 hypothetical protein SAMN03159363_6248 [Variovorax sp. EL159]